MEIESKYLVPRPEVFSAALALEALGQYRLEAMPPVHVQDDYVDTDSADLLNHAYVLRIRSQGDAAQATLKNLGTPEGPLHRRIEIEERLEQALDEDGHLAIPDGVLKDRVDALIGGRTLAPLVQLRQYRSPRVVFDGNRLVGVLSLDIIAIETEVGPDVSHQVEVELAEDGRETDIYRLDPVLKERGMEQATRSKFERGLILLQRNPANALILLPGERTVLRHFSEAGTPLFRRRARVILHFARGLSAAAVANKVGLSYLRVEHWLDAFRRTRMDIFEDATTDHRALLGHSDANRYAISELVSSGSPVPELFPHGAAHVGFAELIHPPSFGLQTAASPASDPPDTLDAFDSGGMEVRSEIVREESEETRFNAPEPDGAKSGGDGFGERFPSLAVASQPVELGRPPFSPEPAVVPDHFYEEPADARGQVGQPIAQPHRKAEVRWADKSSATRNAATTGPVAKPNAGSISPNGEKQEVEAITGLAIPIPDRPVLRAEDAVLAAAERVLTYQFAWHRDAVNRVQASGGEPRSIRRFLVAVHRLRIALQLFEDYLPPRPVKRLHTRMRAMARMLEVVGDLDHVISHVSSAQSEASEEEAADFAHASADLKQKRDSEWQAVRGNLDGADHARWTHRLQRVVERLALQAAESVEVDEFTPLEPDDYLEPAEKPPRRTRLQHMLGSAVWRRYEGLRAFVTTADDTAEDPLHSLGVACAAMQYVLSLSSGCASRPVGEVAGPMARLESHIAVFHHARLTANALDVYPDLNPVTALRDKLREIQTEVIAEVADLKSALVDTEYRQSLARVVASL